MLSSFPVENKLLLDESTERRELPKELIEEILSWLPVKSAVRFNIVCKLFHTIIQDPKFMEKHMHHAKIDKKIVTEPNNPPINAYSRINGLILERVRSTRRLQIRNYATNKILQLPELKESLFSCGLSHISHTNEYKVSVVVYKQGSSGIGMKVLTVGTDIAWRPIEIPISVDWHKNLVNSISALEGITYIVEFSKPNLKQSKMIAFKPEDETFMEIPMPREVLLSESKFWAIECDLTISLICRVDGGFCLWVMDYDNRSKWIEKKIVFETHGTTEDLSILNIAEPVFFSEGWLRCHCSGGDQPTKLLFHIESNRIWYKGTSVPSRVENKNTLVSFRGMH